MMNVFKVGYAGLSSPHQWYHEKNIVEYRIYVKCQKIYDGEYVFKKLFFNVLERFEIQSI